MSMQRGEVIFPVAEMDIMCFCSHIEVHLDLDEPNRRVDCSNPPATCLSCDLESSKELHSTADGNLSFLLGLRNSSEVMPISIFPCLLGSHSVSLPPSLSEPLPSSLLPSLYNRRESLYEIT
mgnify:CR=1 FL=1